ncbi:MAG: 3-methyl-2-oxobutanoate hydroxymethyltransferase [Planctomycetota bacterium]
MSEHQRVTVRTLRRSLETGADPFACLTCYDATTARWLEQAGVSVLLVGDTAAEVILGFDSTIHMTMDAAVLLTAAVRRGAPNTFVMADMPFMSYQSSVGAAMHNAARFMTESGADAVKLEVTGKDLDLVERLAHAGVPVCAHLGSRPQTVALTGGYSAAGRTPQEADRIVHDAQAMVRAGSVLLLIEAVPAEVAQRVVEAVDVPVIGIGAGPAPHGQIVVLHDLLGLSERQPPFAPPLAKLGEEIVTKAREWIDRVASRNPSEHRYRMVQTQPQPGAAVESS